MAFSNSAVACDASSLSNKSWKNFSWEANRESWRRSTIVWDCGNSRPYSDKAFHEDRQANTQLPPGKPARVQHPIPLLIQPPGDHLRTGSCNNSQFSLRQTPGQEQTRQINTPSLHKSHPTGTEHSGNSKCQVQARQLACMGTLSVTRDQAAEKAYS